MTDGMKNVKVLAPLLGLLAAAIGLAVVFGPLGIGAHDVNRTKLEVRFDATEADPLASGKMKWEQRLNDDLTVERQRISVELEDVSTSGSHEVLLNGTSVLFVEVNALGSGNLELDSRDGDTVAAAAIGDLVEVLNPDNAVILSGLLADKDGTDPTDEPDATPDATDEPDATPDATDEPTGTPDATDEPDPTNTPGATDEPGETDTPEPTHTPEPTP